jgi:DUF971 family protein
MMPNPTHLTLHEASRTLEVGYDDGQVFHLPHEFLRVHSPSAEVQGHGPGQETLQVGKINVAITEIETVGHYAVQPRFSDGHGSGLFSWDFLHFLGTQQSTLWAEYLTKLERAHASRQPFAAAARQPAQSGGGCAGGSKAGASPNALSNVAPNVPLNAKEITR